MAFVYDPENRFHLRVNAETLTRQRLASRYWEDTLKQLITTHAAETNSRYAKMLLHDWERERAHFWHVVPKEYVKYLPQPLSDEALEALRA
jgi:glutamate synthase (NADPH/NADH) large chain